MIAIARSVLSVKRISAAVLALMLSIHSAHAGVLPAKITPKVGGVYYTQYNFWIEREKSNATNYSRGELMPFNTKVKLAALNSKKIVLEVDGRRITIVNVPKHTQRGTDKLAAELLTNRKLNLSGISKSRREDMRNGILRLGMNKEQVLITRGYPPKHRTPSTKSNRWTYWSSRFVQRALVFEKGRLARGRGLY